MTIRTERRGPAGIVTIDRPETKNALDRQHAEALAEAIEALAREPSVRGIVLTANGDTFIAGGDLKAFAEILDAPDGGQQVLSFYEPLSQAFCCDVPVVAAIQGDCLGGGAELILMCDLVIMEQHAHISFLHARMGLTPAWGALSQLLERMGPHQVADILLSADRIGAERALELRLINAIADTNGALDMALSRVEAFARSDRASVSALMRVIQAVRLDRAQADRSIERDHFLKSWGGPSHRAAMSAFASRTSPGSGPKQK